MPASGGVVDEAALDVFAGEPLTAAHATLFRGCPNLGLTPRIAGVTQDSNGRISMLIATKLLQVLGGGG